MREKTALAVIVALAAGLRFYGLTHQSIWGDEAFSIYAAKGVDVHFMTASFVDTTHRRFTNPHPSTRDLIVACVKNEGAPPAYYTLLALWIRIWGSGDLACRLLSALIGTFAVAVFFFEGRLLFKNGSAGLLAALLLAVSPINIYFSQEVRAYILAHFAAIASSWLLLRVLAAEDRKPIRWAAYSLAVLILCYSFYFAALTLIAHFIYLLLYARDRIRPWCFSVAVVAILYSPWCLIGLKNQFAVTSGYAPPGPSSSKELIAANLSSLRYVADSLIFGPLYSRVLITDRIKAVTGIGMLALLIIGTIRLRLGGKREAATFCLLLALVPLAIITLYGVLKGTLWYMKPRYHLWETSGIFLLAAGSILSLRSSIVRTFLVCVICALLLLSGPYHIYPEIFRSDHRKPDFRLAASIISSGEQRGDIILVNIPGHMIPLNIYYKGGLRQVGLGLYKDYDLEEKLLAYTRDRAVVWLLVSHDTKGGGDREIVSFLNKHFSSRRAYNLTGLDLIRYSRLNT